jgi:hypothetical protein
MALKFVEHFLWIAAAMNRAGQDRLWDQGDGFFYDQLRLPDGHAVRLRVRSLVGLLPLCAATVIEADLIEAFPAWSSGSSGSSPITPSWWRWWRLSTAPAWPAGGCSPSSTRRSSVASSPGCSTSRSS